MIIAQITDLHVRECLEVNGRTIDTLECTRRAVAHLNALVPRPHAVVVTGDLVAEERLDYYQSVVQALGGLKMPSYVIPGNHDNRDLMREVFGKKGYLPDDGEFLHYTIDDFDLRLIALDTHDPGKESGLLCQTRLDWLEQSLAEAQDRPTLIVMHHPPFITGIPEFDSLGLNGSKAFGEIIAQNTQVQAVACGHVHRDIVVSWCGTLVAVTPSTGYQYGLQLTEGQSIKKVADPPVTRLFQWNPKAGLTSYISYVTAESG